MRPRQFMPKNVKGSPTQTLINCQIRFIEESIADKDSDTWTSRCERICT